MFIKVADFRNDIRHLSELTNTHYHSCVSWKELEYWLKTTQGVLSEVEAVKCKRAKPEDLENHAVAIKACKARMEHAKDRIKKMKAEDPRVNPCLNDLPEVQH